MSEEPQGEETGPAAHTVASGSGLAFRILENGSVASIAHGRVHLNLVDGSLTDGGCVRMYLRLRAPRQAATPILGPEAPGEVAIADGGFASRGEWEGLRYECRLLLAKEECAWLWDVEVVNAGDAQVEVDLLNAQDAGLRPPGLNPAFVSQYIDHAILDHAEVGRVVCSRQNLAPDGPHPWMLVGALERAASASTDGFQFYGRAHNVTGTPRALGRDGLEGLRQYEVSMPAVQAAPVTLAPGARERVGFFGVYRDDHPEATSEKDLDIVTKALPVLRDLRGAVPAAPTGSAPPVRSIFATAALVESENLTDAELSELFGDERAHVEEADGELLSFFRADGRHVVMKAKESLVERPHGHIMKTGRALVPDESVMSTTAYIHGVFGAQLAQGNTSRNAVFSVSCDPLNVERRSGQRIFVKLGDSLRQLGVPSAFEMALNGCRWIYKAAGRMIEVRSWTAPLRPEVRLSVRVLSSEACEWIVTNHLEDGSAWGVEADGDAALRLVPAEGTPVAREFPGGSYRLRVLPADAVRRIGGDELIFADGRSRSRDFIVIETEPLREFEIVMTGALVPSSETDTEADAEADMRVTAEAWTHASSGLALRGPPPLDTIRDILPWFGQNALIHYLTPRGLEQYGGGGWGTRDVCQGPLELLLALGRRDEARSLLLTVFTNQKPDGDWAQAFLFDRWGKGATGNSHSDIIFWPVLALARYVRATGDTGVLDEVVPFLGPEGDERAPVAGHVERALACIASRFVPGTSLIAYGDGDWNDSMTPADPELKKRLISSWTVGLSYQTLSEYAEVCRASGNAERAAELDRRCDAIREDLNRVLVRDGVIAGYVYVEPGGGFRHMLHPSDDTTGIRYRLLPMIRGVISEVFTDEQARRHLALIEEHLTGPDGARLMDRPPVYRGGIARHFSRAETSPFFGREIGIMYMHAHLRYSEALARTGRATEFLAGLRKVVPVGLGDVVPTAAVRQNNCYFSSSDAAFLDRYTAGERYGEVRAGTVPLKSGWRIYSSGAGIFVSLVVTRMLGLRESYGRTVIDPVVAPELDRMTAAMRFRGRDVEFVYRVTGGGAGPKSVRVNGRPIDFEREANPYREGGASIGNGVLDAALDGERNVVEIEV